MVPHQVSNQPPPLEGYNAFTQDPALTEGVTSQGAAWAGQQLSALGERAGSAEAIAWGRDANAHPPLLRTHDRFGHRIDLVEYHPSYHHLMTVAVAQGLHAAPWRCDPRRTGSHVARAAGFYLWSQVDAGHGCPISMTYSVLPVLQPEPELVARWQPRLTSDTYDPSFRSNASAEIELEGAWAERVGEEGRGVATIIEMVNHTRLDCVIGAASGMRQALAQATHHCAYRHAFGRPLAEQPLMTNVLADLAVEAEAATTTMVRLAGAYDRAGDDEHEALFRRLATAVSKYWLCKRHPVLAAEALECLGGNGFVEESMMPRLFREIPLNGIWEGSGKVICLDVLRAMARRPESVEAFFAELARAHGADRRLDLAVDDLRRRLNRWEGLEAGARQMVEKMALVLQGALLVRHAPPAIADAFCASRVEGDWGRAFGTLPAGLDLRAIVARATPKLA